MQSSSISYNLNNAQGATLTEEHVTLAFPVLTAHTVAYKKPGTVITLFARMCLILIVTLLSVRILTAAPIPGRPSRPVADYASLISNDIEESITSICQSLYEQAQFSLVIAIFDSIGDYSVEEFAVKLYESWGIGLKGKDEGALILLSLNPRRVRIEVGYGSEGYLNDAKTGRLLDEVGLPSFRTGNYGAGMLALSANIAAIVAKEKQIELTLPAAARTTGYTSAQHHRHSGKKSSPVSTILFIIIIAIMLSTRMGRTILFWMILSGLSGGRRTGGGFGGGFGGGGFGGGFGGGTSGGGGASRSF